LPCHVCVTRAAVLLCLLLASAPAFAQSHIELILDVEGVHRSEHTEFRPNETRYQPQFDDGGGLGAGINWFFSDRVSLETKVASLASEMRVRRTGSDFITVQELGYAQIYPITAILQWHLFEDNVAIRPYVGVGAAYAILRDIDNEEGSAEFEDPTGLVVNAGVKIPMSSRFSFLADARYVPVESRATARFAGQSQPQVIDVRPLIVSFGVGWRF
jgi:outer membrane protein W